MEFHPDKCEVISVTRMKHPTLHPYYIHGHQLKNVDHVKYLAINITSDLRWDKHVDIICNKANSALGFIRCSVNIGNAKVKALAYKYCVRPVLEYSTMVWNHTPLVPPGSWSRYKKSSTLYSGSYCRTSSVDAMLTQLECC